MENSAQLLDQGFVQENKNFDVEAHLASGGKRFLNNLLDTIFVIILYFILIVFVAASGTISEDSLDAISYLIYPLTIVYYVVFEAASGKTIGKLITGCKVVNMDGENISFGQALGRALCRFIPFDAFSFLGSKAAGWHDTIPNTRVIDSRF